jgi:hypothetical protein
MTKKQLKKQVRKLNTKLRLLRSDLLVRNEELAYRINFLEQFTGFLSADINEVFDLLDEFYEEPVVVRGDNDTLEAAIFNAGEKEQINNTVYDEFLEGENPAAAIKPFDNALQEEFNAEVREATGNYSV